MQIITRDTDKYIEIPNGKEVWLGFQITSKGYKPEWCYTLVHLEGDPKTAAFSDSLCVKNNFTVSWGYAKDNDVGVMTVTK